MAQASTIREKVSPRYGQIMKFLGFKGAEITVGIHGSEGGKAHEGSHYSIAEIAEVHEFGLGHVPQRSWLRGWFDENEREIETTLTSQITLSLRESRPLFWALERVALWAQGSIQQRIAEGIAPALHPRTIKRKGSSVPLIDTGLMRAAIIAKAVQK